MNLCGNSHDVKYMYTYMRRLAAKKVVGEEIRRIRDELDLSQPAFAMKIGRPKTDQGLVSRWERGEVYPPEDDLIRIAELGGVPADVFTEEAPDTEDRGRRHMLLAATWMERLARELRERASLPPGSREDPNEIAAAVRRAHAQEDGDGEVEATGGGE